MKKLLLLSISVILFSSCKNDAKETMPEEPAIQENPAVEEENNNTPKVRDTISVETTVKEVPVVQISEKASTLAFNKKKYASFGATFMPSTVLNKEQMLNKYKNLKAGRYRLCSFPVSN